MQTNTKLQEGLLHQYQGLYTQQPQCALCYSHQAHCVCINKYWGPIHAYPDIYESAAYSNRIYLSTHIHDIRIIKLKRNLVYTCINRKEKVPKK